MNVAVSQNGKAYIFGGVLDVEEDEENLSGQFSNELHSFDLSNQVWRLIELSGKKEEKIKKTKLDSKSDDSEMDSTTPNSYGKIEKIFFLHKSDFINIFIDIKFNFNFNFLVSSDGVFTMTVGGSSSQTSSSTTKASTLNINVPSLRMKPGIAVCRGNLYLYGGSYENGSKQYTLNDFYSLGTIYITFNRICLK